ncbi:MAG: hypothetical protein QOH67_4441, partial [Hyphomicrobiales bacterium]|nr:hypothetical protein [Hyphomicrobiales bacterium]
TPRRIKCAGCTSTLSSCRRLGRLLLLLSFAAGHLLYGQAASGTLFGTITDPSGGAVANARVTITSTERGTVYTTDSNDSGNYQQTQLLPGGFSINVQAAGFQRYLQQDVTVSLGQSRRVDIPLTVGEVSQQVTVSGETPALVTDRAEVTVALENKQIAELPIVNRNFTYLQLAMPGSQLAPGQHAASENPQQGLQINTNGQRFGANSFMIDGADNNDKVLGIIVVNPSIDAVSEAKFTTGNYDAEFSQAGGALIQVETKSGTNQYHGSLFEYLQNNVLNARNPFSQPNGAPPLKWNQFGGSLGAPIKKDKLFVFGDYQGTRRRTGSSILTTVPTQAERNGDFSALGTPIFDPDTGSSDGTGRQQFTGNVIPPSRISSQATKVLSLLPLPNASAPGAFNSNYTGSGSQKFDTNQFDVRADHVISERFRYFSRYSYSKFSNQAPAAFGLAGGPGLSGLNFAGLATALNQNLVAGFNRVISPTLLTDFRFGFTRYRVNVQSLDYGINASETAGIPGINMPGDIKTSGLSEFNVTGRGGFQEGYGLANNQCNCPLAEREFTYQAVNNWTKVIGNHTIKWGEDVRYAQNLRLASDSTRNGLFTFSPSITGNATVTGSGLGPAAFLLGLPSAFTRSAQRGSPEDLQWSMFYFVQDTWRATQKLTLSYGLRWDTWFPDHTLRAGEGGRYDVTINSILVAGVGNNDKGSGVRTQWRNLSPRLGIAYAFSPRTVIRTGWGRSYFEEIFGANFNDIATVYPTTITQTPPQATPFAPVFTLSQGPPAAVFPTVPSNGILLLPPNVGATYRPANLKIPYVDSWNFSVEHEFPGALTATVSYVANAGRHEGLSIPLNQATPGPGPLNPRRPLFNKFGVPQSISDGSDALSNSYQSLQTKLTKRYSHGVTLFANYTFSKSIDTAGGLGAALGLRLNHAVEDWDRTHVFSVGHTLDLPFGNGRAYLSNVHGVAAQIINGWEFTGITQYMSGLPFSPTLSNNASINADVTLRPDLASGTGVYDIPGGQSRNLWYNPAAFTVPGPYRFGTAGRNILRGPNSFTANWSLFKTFTIAESKKLEFRWETFNLFNRANLANPSGQVDAGPGVSGVVTNVATNMRQMQVGLHLRF